MRFSYSNEQRAIAESVRRCLADSVPSWPDARWANPGGIARELAPPLSELGLFGLLAPERVGGSGLGVVDGVLAALEAGRETAPFPLVEVIAAAQVMAKIAPDALDTVLGGREMATIAWSADCRFAGRPGRSQGTARLRGVPFATEARWIVAPASLDGHRSGVILFDASAEGVSLHARDSLDLTCAIADITIEGTRAVTAVGDEADWQDLRAAASVLYAADLVGTASACFERSLKHLQDREQFGQPIGRYQALRHLAADDHMRLENSRLAVDYAAWALSACDPGAREAVDVAKAYVSRACRVIAENSIQIHGGMGFTWDFPAHVSLRRILRLAVTPGSDLDLLDKIAGDLLSGRSLSAPALAGEAVVTKHA